MTEIEDPEDPQEPETFALPVDSLSHLADLLGELDTFLRSGHPVGDQLTDYMRRRGHPHPGLAACNLIDDLCFTAFRLPPTRRQPPRPAHHGALRRRAHQQQQRKLKDQVSAGHQHCR